MCNGFLNFGNNSWWIIILILILVCGCNDNCCPSHCGGGSTYSGGSSCGCNPCC